MIGITVPQADTNSYEVTYEQFNDYSKIPTIIGLMLGINYNVDLNARRVITPATENTPEQATDVVVLQISKNGVNPVVLVLGQVLVWDNNWLYAMSEADFMVRYTPKP